MNIGSRELFAEDISAKYSAKDYVQNSLIAMWDGEWNVSVGVHDPNAQYPNEIVSNSSQLLVGQIATGKTSFCLEMAI